LFQAKQCLRIFKFFFVGQNRQSKRSLWNFSPWFKVKIHQFLTMQQHEQLDATYAGRLVQKELATQADDQVHNPTRSS